jgi:hypothetical protein
MTGITSVEGSDGTISGEVLSSGIWVGVITGNSGVASGDVVTSAGAILVETTSEIDSGLVG